MSVGAADGHTFSVHIHCIAAHQLLGNRTQECFVKRARYLLDRHLKKAHGLTAAAPPQSDTLAPNSSLTNDVKAWENEMAAIKARIAELEAILRSKGVQRRRSAGLQTRSAEKPLKKKKGGDFHLVQGFRSRLERRSYCNFAYSALACCKIGISGSASFQRVRKS